MENYIEKENIRSKKYADKIIKTLPPYCHAFFTHIRADQYSEKTVLNYASGLDAFFRFVIKNNPTIHAKQDITPEFLNKLTIEDIDEYKMWLSYKRDEDGKIIGKSSGNSICSRLSALRSFFRFCFARNIIRQNIMPEISNPKFTQKGIVYLESDEISDMLTETIHKEHFTDRQRKYCQSMTLRDYAIILTLISTGIRVSELVGIDTTSIDYKNQSFYIHRKGNKEQYIYFSDDVLCALKEYVAFERKPYDPSDQALFLSNRGTRITVRSVERIVHKYTQSPEVTIKHITPHKLRSTFGTNLYRETGDIYLTADILGHTSVSTTAKHYSAQSEINRQKAREIKFIKK